MAGSSGSRPVAPREGASRDPFLDNAKLLLIVLVVVGHDWVPAVEEFRWVKAAYLVVYTFHVPAFVLLCGYFSRGFQGRPDQWRKLVVSVLVPYLIFQTAYSAVTTAVGHHPFKVHLSGPIYVCWFLLALFVWRAGTPLLRSLPHLVPLAFALSLATGVLVVDTGFALSRTLQLLPWFAIGLLLQPHHLALLRRRGVRAAALAAMAVAAATAWGLAPGFDVRWLDREWDAERLGASIPVDLGMNAAIDVATAVLVVAALALVPRRRTRLTALGAATMYPFLLHGLVVRVVQHAGVHRFLIGTGPLGVVAITAGAILLALLLATPVVRWATGWAVEPAAVLSALRRRRRPTSGPLEAEGSVAADAGDPQLLGRARTGCPEQDSNLQPTD